MVAENNFVVRIPISIYNEMVDHVLAGYPDEACGALGSQGDQVVKHYPTANAAADKGYRPDDFSIISEADMVRIYNEIDEYDGELIYYHSHPVSEAYPSARDIEWAKVGGYLYLIFSLQYRPKPPYARIFRIAADGTVTEGNIELIKP
jgi:proteasome lid subunit RPN8/RPN11